jgi:hypothetical protein
MKPLLPAPLTPEDNNVWLFSARRPLALHPVLWDRSQEADRRDAALMSWLSNFGHRHYARMPKMPKSAQLPIAHLWLRIDSEWPRGHYMIDLT